VTDALRKRVLTAVVLGAVLLAIVLWLPAEATVGVMTLLVLAGAWEWSAFLLLGTPALRTAYVLLVAALLLGAWRVSATPEGRDLLLSAAVLWWLTALLWIAFAPRRVSPWSAAAAGVLALVPAWLALVRLRLALPHGAQWVLFALLLVWVADIGAFFCGRRFGRIRLAPNVSPGKTWEGVLGAVAVSALVALAAEGDPRRVRRVAVRFVAPAFLGHDLTVQIFERPGSGFALEAGGGEHRVIKNGFIEIVS